MHNIGSNIRRLNLVCLALVAMLFALSGNAEGKELPGTDSGEKHAVVNGSLPDRMTRDPFSIPVEIAESTVAMIDKTGIKDDSGKCADLDSKGEKPKIALIIDDMGNHGHIGEKLLELDLDLTLSFLPSAPFTRKQEEEAWLKGRDILVHMPMEPKDPQWDPGPNALYVDDSAEQLAWAIEKNLTLVPHAIGVNNHMGSLFTENRRVMHQLLEIIDHKGMFFVDSMTSGASIGMEVAQDLGMKAVHRHVFLDNIQTQEDICHQLKQLISIARKRGWAIGIGHANEATLQALADCRETLLEYVTVVGIHELVN